VGEFFGRKPIDQVGAGRSQRELWQAIRRVPPRDVPILLAVARLLAGRREATTHYRGLQAAKVAAEQRSGYRRRPARHSTR
jgi:hypothetical protein